MYLPVSNPGALLYLGDALEDALRGATYSMADWLKDEYKLTPTEQAQFLGVASEFHISEVADRNAGIVLKIKKRDLETLTK